MAVASTQIALGQFGPPSQARAVAGRSDEEVRRVTGAVNSQLGLRESRVFALPARRLSQYAVIQAPLDGTDRTIELRPYSPLAENYELVVDGPDGARPVATTHPQTVRGTVVGLDGVDVAGVLTADGLQAMILMPDGQRRWLEPAPAVGGSWRPGDHVLYRDEDRIATPPVCSAVGAGLQTGSILPGRPQSKGKMEEPIDAAGEPNDLRFTEVAVDTDVEFFNYFGSVAAVEAEVTNLINIVNLEYERDVRISHLIVRLIVRTAEPDPYGATAPGTLLDQFRNHWFSMQTTVHRDVAHFMTGKLLQDGIGGVAFYSGICSNVEGYSLVSRRACVTLACKTDLSAHELGHNWAAPHCACPGWTMNPIVQGANQFHPEFTIPIIVNYRDSDDVNCLEIGDDLEGLRVAASATTVAESNAVPLTALAEFRLHADRDVTTEVLWNVDPPALGTLDAAGVFAAAQVDGALSGTISASYSFDGVEESDAVAVTVVDAQPAPLRDPATPDKNRFLSISVPAGAGEVAVAVRMVSMYRPDPPHVASVIVPNFTPFQGEVRWVGPVTTCTGVNGPAEQFACATLQCTPYYSAGWGTDVIHVISGEIIPSSLYELRTYPAVPCRDAEATCGMGSAVLLMETRRFADVVPPFQTATGGPPGSASQPDVLDVSAVVTKLAGLPAIPTPQAVLRANTLQQANGVTVIDVSDAVDAVKGAAPLWIGPCACPSEWTCPSLDFCGRCNP